MRGLPILVLVASAVLFYRAATYERMNALIWVAASLGAGLIGLQVDGVGAMLAGQVGLFGVMWWYNAWRRSRPKT